MLDALDQAAAGVDVLVDPRFGTWDAASGLVVPPEGAADPPGAEVVDPFAGLGLP